MHDQSRINLWSHFISKFAFSQGNWASSLLNRQTMSNPFDSLFTSGINVTSGTQSYGYGAQNSGYGAQNSGYGAQNSGYGAQNSGYGTAGYGAQPMQRMPYQPPQPATNFQPPQPPQPVTNFQPPQPSYPPPPSNSMNQGESKIDGDDANDDDVDDGDV
jgi:hypothetical protein